MMFIVLTGCGSGNNIVPSSQPPQSSAPDALAYASALSRNFVGVQVKGANAASSTGSPYSTAQVTRAVAAAGNLLFVLTAQGANTDTGAAISVYRVDTSTGAVALLATHNDAQYADWIIPNSTGAFLYALGGSSLYGFAVDANSGAFTPVPGSPYSAPVFYDLIIYKPMVSPDGAWVCISVPGQNAPAVGRCYRRDGNTGALPEFPNFVASFNALPVDVAFTPNSAFIVNIRRGPPDMLYVSPTPGTGGNEHSIALGITGSDERLAVHPSGGFVAVAVSNANENTVEVFSLDASGNPALAGSSSVSNGGTAMNATVAFSRSGQYLFANSTSGIAVFSFSNGTLTPLGAPVAPPALGNFGGGPNGFVATF